ncbi:MAG: hypothetical protein K2X11_10320 [Acetobacteraceae bacterium]|nr:hypothetical protein [Acetobacteraceae bacterium]
MTRSIRVLRAARLRRDDQARMTRSIRALRAARLRRDDRAQMTRSIRILSRHASGVAIERP